MKVNVGLAAHNTHDWDRVLSGDFSQPMARPDHKFVEEMMVLGDLAEPLGFDGIWAAEHTGTPYNLTPNPVQLLTYFAGRTERVTFGSMVIVAPWWNPVRLAHQIAYLDILSNGRFETIGLGRGVAKSEFDAVGVPREESRERFMETLDILELAFNNERWSYDGQFFKIPEMSVRPAPKSKDLASRLYGSAGTPDSLEILSRRGMVPLFVGNKPIEAAGQDVLKVNQFRAEEGLAPCQPKNVVFMYCVPDAQAASQADEWMISANRDVTVHYGFADASNFKGVKGYESYAAREGAATALLSDIAAKGIAPAADAKPKTPGYHPSNLMIGTPEDVYKRIVAAQEVCSFSEVTIVPQFGHMPAGEAERSMRLFAAEVLPELHKLNAKLQPGVVPETANS